MKAQIESTNKKVDLLISNGLETIGSTESINLFELKNCSERDLYSKKIYEIDTQIFCFFYDAVEEVLNRKILSLNNGVLYA